MEAPEGSEDSEEVETWGFCLVIDLFFSTSTPTF